MTPPQDSVFFLFFDIIYIMKIKENPQTSTLPNWHFPKLAVPPTGSSPNWHFSNLHFSKWHFLSC